MRLSVIALGLLVVACGSVPTRSGSQLDLPAAAATAAPTTRPAAVAGFNATLYIGQGDRYSCDDFANQAQAQAVLRVAPADPNRLDADRDGIACETNNAPHTGSQSCGSYVVRVFLTATNSLSAASVAALACSPDTRPKTSYIACDRIRRAISSSALNLAKSAGSRG